MTTHVKIIFLGPNIISRYFLCLHIVALDGAHIELVTHAFVNLIPSWTS